MLINFIDLYKEPVFYFTAFIYLLFSVSFISALILIFFCLFQICSSFSSFLRYKLRLLILDLSPFLIHIFNTIYFPLNTASSAFETLINCVFIFIYFKTFKNLSSDFFHLCVIYKLLDRVSNLPSAKPTNFPYYHERSTSTSHKVSSTLSSYPFLLDTSPKHIHALVFSSLY